MTNSDVDIGIDINVCPICQEPLNGALALPVGCTVPCGHVFHNICVKKWKEHSSESYSSKRCPCCNTHITAFIDKIHISFPSCTLFNQTGTTSMEATSDTRNDQQNSALQQQQQQQLERRRRLSNEKAAAKQKAAAAPPSHLGHFHQQHYGDMTTGKQALPSPCKHLEQYNDTVTSLSASLQRTEMYDAIKKSNITSSCYSNMSSIDDQKSNDETLLQCNESDNDGRKSNQQHLASMVMNNDPGSDLRQSSSLLEWNHYYYNGSNEFPNIAEKIMQNIKRRNTGTVTITRRT